MSPRSEYRQPPEDDGENSLLVTQLFGEWLSRREGPGEEQDVKSFLERAGNRSGELDQRIRLYLAMESFGGGVPESDEGSARIGRFQVLRTLGEGGLSSVYLALDPELKHEVALKVLRSNSGQGQGWILNEARSLARVQHPGVVRVFEVQRAGTSHVVVMEHLSGHSLDEIIDELCALKSELVRTSAADRKEKESKKSRKRQDAEALEPLSHRIRILLYLADALAHCHDRGILHRDIKPANIVFGGDGQPRLIDFGLAHLGENKDKETSLDITQNLVASPAYMAPEQVESEKTGADPRTDQFSFAVVAYELLTLQHPFLASSRGDTLNAISRAMPLLPRKIDRTIPADLERVLMHALERKPEDRYPTMAGLCTDLRAILDHRSISVNRPGPLHRLGLVLRRHRRFVASVAVTTALLVGFLATAKVRSAFEARSQLANSLTAFASTCEGRLDADTLYRDGLRLAAYRAEAGQLRSRLLPDMGFPDALALAETAYGASVSRGAMEAASRLRPGLAQYSMASWIRCIQMLEERLEGISLEESVAGASTLALRFDGPVDLKWTFLKGVPLESQLNIFPAAITTFREIQLPERPEPGRYRVILSDRETGTVVADASIPIYNYWHSAYSFEIRRPNAMLFAESIRLARRELVVEPSLSPRSSDSPEYVKTLRVPSFRVMPRHVSRGEFEAFCRETGHTPEHVPIYAAIHVEEDPAWVAPRDARAFALWAGGRIPTMLELFLLRQEVPDALRSTSFASGQFSNQETGPNPEDSPKLIQSAIAEWIEDASFRADASSYQFFKFFAPSESEDGSFEEIFSNSDSHPPYVPLHLQSQNPQGPFDFQGGFAFRLVFPEDTLDAQGAQLLSEILDLAAR